MSVSSEDLFGQILGLGEDWEVHQTEYVEEKNTIFIRVRETASLLSSQRCREDKRYKVKLYDHAPSRFWRHLNVFNRECVIECALPRLQCKHCGKVWRAKAPWEGKCKGLSSEFEAFALTLMKEMPVKSAGKILGENDHRLWRVLRAYVEEAKEALDFESVTRVGSDELSYRKGHKYLTVFADMKEKRVLFATKGKGKETWEAFSDELLKRNGHPHAITHAAIDMSPSYQSGVRNNCRNARIVLDRFHVMKLIGDRVDEVRQAENRRGTTDAKKQLKKTMWLWRKNPENLTEPQRMHFDRIDHDCLWTSKAYQMRLALRNIYNQVPYESWARRRLQSWCHWVRKTAAKAPHLFASPMLRAAESIEKHQDGILAFWGSGRMTTAYLEGLNSVFSAVKRKARGFRNPDNLITMLYFVAGKIDILKNKQATH